TAIRPARFTVVPPPSSDACVAVCGEDFCGGFISSMGELVARPRGLSRCVSLHWSFMSASSSPLKAVRGTRDLLPPETALWARIEQTARDVFARYGFGEIRTPIFEATELFARGVGEETDIVSKEMYTWEDRARAQSEKAQSLTLRPEN